jgi:hypothetical protein
MAGVGEYVVAVRGREEADGAGLQGSRGDEERRHVGSGSRQPHEPHGGRRIEERLGALARTPPCVEEQERRERQQAGERVGSGETAVEDQDGRDREQPPEDFARSALDVTPRRQGEPDDRRQARQRNGARIQGSPRPNASATAR